MRSRQYLGRYGEELACRHLKREGYRVVFRNYRTPLGEIDIVARNGRGYLFTEVKTRSSSYFGLPEEAVTYKKRRSLYRASLAFAKRFKLQECNLSFGVVAIIMDGKRPREIRLIVDAFGEEEC